MKDKLKRTSEIAVKPPEKYNLSGIAALYKRSQDEKGVALLLILWVIFLLSVLAAEFAFSMRTDFVITLNFKEEMEAYYLARAGVNQAIAKVLREKMIYDQKQKNRSDPTFSEEEEDFYPSQELTKKLEHGTFSYELIDEEGKININSLKKNTSHHQKILRCLLEEAAGVTNESTQNTIIESIMDWMDPDDLFKTSGAEEDYYQDLSPPYHCKNGPFDTVEELLLVQGITWEILFGGTTSEGGKEKTCPGIGRYLTVWTGGKFNKRAAKLATLNCKLGEEAAEKEMERRIQEENAEEELSELQKKEPPPSRHWIIESVGRPTSGNSKRTIRAAIKVIKQKKINVSTVKILYWNDNYIDRYVSYQEPEEVLIAE
jgi:hypothetical protein